MIENSDLVGKAVGIYGPSNVHRKASSEGTDPGELRSIAMMNNRLKLAVAKNPACPIDLLMEFIESKNLVLRRAALHNSSCPFEVSVLGFAELAIEEERLDELIRAQVR